MHVRLTRVMCSHLKAKGKSQMNGLVKLLIWEPSHPQVLEQ